MKALSLLTFTVALTTWSGLADSQTWCDSDTGFIWTYTTTNGQVSVGGGSRNLPALSKDISSHVSIPSHIAGLPVTAIGDYAFCCCTKLPSVAIPDGVKTIGKYAFSECYKMAPPKLPSELIEIGEDAFDRCFAIETISIPSSVTNISTGAFLSSGLKTIFIPEGVKNIGPYAFASCSQLWSAYIPKSVEQIGNTAFSQCTELSAVVISDGVKTIGDRAFQMCYALNSINIPPSVTKIGHGCFSECTSLNAITLNDGLLEIGAEAFSECYSLTEITIPGTVSILANDIFYKCDKLTSVNIRPGVTTFWSYVFDHCFELKTLIIPPSVNKLSSGSFRNCPNLEAIYFRGDAPSAPSTVFSTDMNPAMVIYVREGSTGWNGSGSTTLPASWRGYAIAYGSPENSEQYTAYDVVFANSVVPNQHWNSEASYRLPLFKGWQSSKDGKLYGSGVIVSNLAKPGEKVTMSAIWDTSDPGPIETIDDSAVITEINSGKPLSIPLSWTQQYPSFEARYGKDLPSALIMETGKIDASGNKLLVWHDYVAGTDPTNQDELFTASIVIKDGAIKILCLPELSDREKAKRKYTIYGKHNLSDSSWSVINNTIDDYKFFKVAVEMR